MGLITDKSLSSPLSEVEFTVNEVFTDSFCSWNVGEFDYIDSIRNPIITEKATILSEQNKTVFRVHDKANKKNIKKNIEKLFKVNVVKINIINQKTKIKMKQGKKSYKSGYKKAIVTLKKGQSIDLTTGI